MSSPPSSSSSAEQQDQGPQHVGQYADFDFTPEQLVEAYTSVEKLSGVFPKFPTKENLLHLNPSSFAAFYGLESEDEYKAQIGKFAIETRPIIHEKVLQLIHDFVAFKRSDPTCIESKIYTDDFNELDFVDRMIKCRPLVFFTGGDSFLLKNYKTSGSGGFRTMSSSRHPDDFFKEYMTYDEMAISSMMGVSVPTFFINAGTRNNCGKTQRDGNFEKQGVYVGLVGARFEVDDEMESLHMTVPSLRRPRKTNEHRVNLLKDVWAKFYTQKTKEGEVGEYPFPEWEEAVERIKKKTCEPYTSDRIFNISVYRQRMRLSIDAFILDADQRAQAQGKKAYVHAVGLGLGVWMVLDNQGIWLTQEFIRSLVELQPKNIGVLDFSWFPPEAESVLKTNLIPVGDGDQIEVKFSRRNPADKLTGKYKDHLLVASYAWDGNSFPGNEYWFGSLAASGDPAAACCSMIPQLQNPLINPFLSSYNLFVASTKHKRIMSFQEYRLLESQDSPWLPEKPSRHESPFLSNEVFSVPPVSRFAVAPPQLPEELRSSEVSEADAKPSGEEGEEANKVADGEEAPKVSDDKEVPVEEAKAQEEPPEPLIKEGDESSSL